MSPGRIWAACLVALAALIALPHPELYLPTCIGAVLIGAGAWIARVTAQRDDAVVEAWDERFKRTAAEHKAKELEAALMAADQENAILSGRLEDVVEVPRLRVVRSPIPMQRDGSEYEWPRVARQIEHDDMTALMRATEEK